MLAAGVGEVAHLGQEVILLRRARPYRGFADHVVERRRAFQVVDLDDGGGLARRQQRRSVRQHLDRIEMDPIPFAGRRKIRLVDARVVGGHLVFGEHVAHVQQRRHLAGVRVQLDDLVLHAAVAAVELGGQQHQVLVGVERVIVVQDVPVSQVQDLDEPPEPVHRRHLLGGRGEPHQAVVVEQQAVAAVEQDRHLAAQHAVGVVVEHEVLIVAVVAQDRVQAVAQVDALGRLDRLFQPHLLGAEQAQPLAFDDAFDGAARLVGDGQRDRVRHVGQQAEHQELVLGRGPVDALVGVRGEVRVALGRHRVADGRRLFGGEIDVQRARVRGVGVVLDVDVVDGAGLLVTFGDELFLPHLLEIGGVDVLDQRVEPLDAGLSDGCGDVGLRQQAEQGDDDDRDRGEDPAQRTGVQACGETAHRMTGLPFLDMTTDVLDTWHCYTPIT